MPSGGSGQKCEARVDLAFLRYKHAERMGVHDRTSIGAAAQARRMNTGTDRLWPSG